METLLRDIRYAVTIMRRNPGFTAAGLLTLALGIGATTAVFSIVYGVLMGEVMRGRVVSIVERARALPGVVSAGAGNMMPLDAMSQIAGFLAAPIVLSIVATIACLLPARRAAATDPAEALRTD